MTLPIQLRDPKAEDLNFIYSSWLKSYRVCEDSSRMSNDTYYSNYKKTVERLLESSSAIVACNPEDSDQVYGYIILQIVNEVKVVHYIYTKFTYRKLGVARSLLGVNFDLGTEPIVVTHANRVFDKNRDKYILTYNPYVKEGK